MAKGVPRIVAKSPRPDTPSVPQPGAYVRPDKPRTPRVALVGFCANTRHLVPYNDPELTVYGLNKGYVFQPRADVWFETHGPKVYQWQIRRPDRHMQWLKAFAGPIYMHQADPELPNSLAYPLAEVAADVMPATVYRWKMLGGAGTAGLVNEKGERILEAQRDNPYLTSTIALQIALAIYERFEQIELYGIDLNTGGEYAWQKPGVEYLLGIAAQRGMTVVIPDDAALLKGKIYGRGFMKPEGEAITKTQYETRLAEVRQKREAVAQRFHQLHGAKTELQYVMDQMPPGLNHEHLADRSKQLQAALDQCQSEANQLVGSEKEIMYWVAMTPEGQPGDQALKQLAAPSSSNGAAEKHDILASEELVAA